MKFKDISGHRFGRLTAISVHERRISSGNTRIFWKCLCDCGSEVIIVRMNLHSNGIGGSKSCGCLKLEKATSHGKTKTKEYRAWASMHQRCNNPKNKRYEGWGGRGITVCDRWTSFECFLSDMGCRPSDEYSLDRINNDGNYEPSNCKWSTRSEQQLNKRTSK